MPTKKEEDAAKVKAANVWLDAHLPSLPVEIRALALLLRAQGKRIDAMSGLVYKMWADYQKKGKQDVSNPE